MIRNLLATTAVATLIATGAFAQTTTPAPETTAPAATDAAPAPTGPAPEAAQVNPADGQIASNIIGETVYNGTGDDAENIGKVNDLVLSNEGDVQAIIIGVGGFLGLGEKNVAINYDEIEWAERDGDRWIVVSATTDQLKGLPDFDRAAYDPRPATESTAMAPANDSATGMGAGTVATAPATAPAADTTAQAPAADTTAQAPAADTTAQAPAADTAAPAATDTETTAAIDRSTLQPLDTATIKAEEFVGTTVYGANDERVGEIGDVVMQGDKVDAVIIDVGGFLGIGEKSVAVGLDNLKFMTDEDGDRYLYTEWTKDALEAQPAYEEGTYAERRDEMRMVVPN